MRKVYPVFPHLALSGLSFGGSDSLGGVRRNTTQVKVTTRQGYRSPYRLEGEKRSEVPKHVPIPLGSLDLRIDQESILRVLSLHS